MLAAKRMPLTPNAATFSVSHGPESPGPQYPKRFDLAVRTGLILVASVESPKASNL